MIPDLLWVLRFAWSELPPVRWLRWWRGPSPKDVAEANAAIADAFRRSVHVAEGRR